LASPTAKSAMNRPWHDTWSDTVGAMPRTPRTSIPAPVLGLLAAILAVSLTACGGGDDENGSTNASAAPSKLPEATASNAKKSCQAIIGSGAVEDVQAIWDKYKGNKTPFTDADAKKMHDALDRLAKAGDNAAPKIREDVVQLVADVGSQIDARIKIEGLGKVAPVAKIQRELDALCR
jgi:hypothetical protein